MDRASSFPHFNAPTAKNSSKIFSRRRVLQCGKALSTGFSGFSLVLIGVLFPFLFELFRYFMVDPGVPALGIVVNLDVLKNLGLSILKTAKSTFLHQFRFEAAEQALAHSIVVMIVPTRHAGLEAMYCRYALTVANHPKGFFFEALIILAVLPTDFCLFHTHSKVSDFCMRINGAISAIPIVAGWLLRWGMLQKTGRLVGG